MDLPVILQTTAVPNWASLGVGGALAGVMFYFYRQDRTQGEKRHAQTKVELAALIERLHADHSRITQEFNVVVQSNTRAIVELSHVLRTKPCLLEDDDIRAAVFDGNSKSKQGE